MRKLLVPVLTIGLTAAALVGCSASDSAAPVGCERSGASDSALLQSIDVTGEFGGTPEVAAYTPLEVSKTEWRDVETGSGTALTSDRQPASLNLTFFSGETGDVAVAGGSTGTISTRMSMSELDTVVPGLSASLDCAQAGTRVVTLVSPADLDPNTATGLGLSEGESAVVVIDVEKVYLAKADGADRFVVGAGLPAVVRAPDGRPGVTIPEGDAPTELRVEVLKDGDGETVEAGQTATIAYTALTWAEGTVFQTSWDSVPIAYALTEGNLEGLTQALEGQQVGSQVLAIIPPELGFGEEETSSVPAGSTLVFVVDILGVDDTVS